MITLNRVIGGAALALGLFTLYLVYSFPFNMPFVDDWMLTQWAVPQHPTSWVALWAKINGHQQIMEKLINVALGKWFHWNLFYASLLSTVTFMLAAILILFSLKTTLRLEQEDRTKAVLLLLSFAGILFSLRQMQNFAQIICLPWTLALFCMGGFAYLWGKNQDGPHSKWILSGLVVATLLAPMTIGMGLTVPFYLFVIGLAYAGMWTWNRLAPAAAALPAAPYGLGVLLIAAAASVYLSFIMPSVELIIQDRSVDGTFPARSFIDLLMKEPLDACKFVFSYFGQAFTPPSNQSDKEATVLGCLLFGSFLVMAGLRIKREGVFHIWDLIYRHSLLVMSLLFSVMLLLLRWQFLGSVGALEPRYTTAAVVLVVSLFAYFYENAVVLKFSERFCLAVLLIALNTWHTGYVAGRSWIEQRSLLAKSQVQCFRDHRDSPLDFQNPCIQSIYPAGMFGQEEFLRWVKLLNENRLTFFADVHDAAAGP